MRILLLALMAAVLTGCVAPAPYEQKIEGIILKSGAPATNVKVRFLSEYPEESCEVPGLEATIDQSGKFKFNQQYIPTKTERYAVVIHPFRLCINTDGKWKTVWKLKTGPAPKSINFRCRLNGNGGAVCDFSWDGQNYRDGQDYR